MFKRILVPIDFSGEAQLALRTAITIAQKENGASINLLHVLTYGPKYEKGWMPKVLKLELKKIKSLVHEWQRKIPEDINSTSIIRKGSFSEIVQKVCKNKKIDVVIMTTHGRRGFNRLVQPNESELVVRTAPCPVLVLHLNKKSMRLARTEKQDEKSLLEEPSCY